MDEANLTRDAPRLLAEIDDHFNLLVDDPAYQGDRIRTLITSFEAIPSLMDASLPRWVGIMCKSFSHPGAEEVVAMVMTCLVSVRGISVVVNHFAAEVYTLPKLMVYIMAHREADTLVVPLLWMCNLVMIPFDLAKVGDDVVESLYSMGATLIVQFTGGSLAQRALSLMFSRLITRLDLQGTLIPKYFTSLVTQWHQLPLQARLGHYIIIADTVKRGNVSDYNDTIFRLLQDGLAHDPTNLIQLSAIKIFTRMASTYIWAHDFENTETITNLLVDDILVVPGPFDENLRYAWARGVARYTGEMGKVAPNYQDQLIRYFDAQLPQGDLRLLNTEKAHTILLFFGFLALDRALPHQWVERAITLASEMILLDQHTHRGATGCSIRDSSAFILWATVKNMHKDDISVDLWRNTFQVIVSVAVTDWELMLRRGSVAVIQEMLGRWGSVIAPESTPENRGKWTMELVECFTTSAVSTLTSSYSLLSQLRKYDFVFDEVLTAKMQPGQPWLQSRLACHHVSWTSEMVSSVKFDSDNLYCVCYGLQKFHIPEIRQRVDVIAAKFTFDGHSSVRRAAGYLRWSLFGIGCWEVITAIILSKLSIHLIDELVDLIRVTSDDKWLPLVAHSQALSQVVSSLSLTDHQKMLIRELINDASVDAEVRAILLKGAPLDEDFSFLMDDYTVTSQGDVGSKVRFAALDHFRLSGRSCSGTIMGKIIRLAGEPVDKLRSAALSILGVDSIWDMYPSLSKEHRLEFWRGMVMSIGGVTIGSSGINTNLNMFFKLFPPHSLEILEYLASLLKPNLGPNYRVVGVLNTWTRIFDARLPIPSEFALRQVLVNAYNCHINTRDWLRVGSVIQLFGRLCEFSNKEIITKIIERFSQLLSHKHPRVRAATNDAIAEIYINHGHSVASLDALDFAVASPQQQQSIVSELKSIYSL